MPENFRGIGSTNYRHQLAHDGLEVIIAFPTRQFAAHGNTKRQYDNTMMPAARPTKSIKSIGFSGSFIAPPGLRLIEVPDQREQFLRPVQALLLHRMCGTATRQL